MIAAGVIGGVFLICTVVMFLGVKESDGETLESRHLPCCLISRIQSVT